MSVERKLIHAGICERTCPEATEEIAQISQENCTTLVGYDDEQEFLAVADRIAREGRLCRFVYVHRAKRQLLQPS